MPGTPQSETELQRSGLSIFPQEFHAKYSSQSYFLKFPSFLEMNCEMIFRQVPHPPFSYTFVDG